MLGCAGAEVCAGVEVWLLTSVAFREYGLMGPAEYWLKHKELKANFLTVLQVKIKATRQKQILRVR